MNCVPFRQKRLYLIMSIPLLILMGTIFLYLWFIYPPLSLIYVGLYLITCIFQAYCCAYQECPYIGKFCPGIFGIIPSSRFAKLGIFQNARKSARFFEIFGTVAFLALLAMIFLPLLWLIQLGTIITILYLGFNIIYFVIFLWNICPNCAIRSSCPAGRVSSAIRSITPIW